MNKPLSRYAIIPVSLILLYWGDAWLYLPVTFIAGLIMLNFLVFPRRMAEESAHEVTSERAIEYSIAAWRRADFSARQRQALASASSDVLTDVVKNGDPDYGKRIESAAEIDRYLAREHDNLQENARKFGRQAFDHKGEIPGKKTAIRGAIAGTIAGIIPILITALTTHPSPDNSGYSVLDFFGGTAWNLQWTGLGWLVGYSLPLIRGRNGSEKALWLFIAGIAAPLPMQAIWSDAGDWVQTLIWSLELLFFLLAIAIYLGDIRTLRVADLGIKDWFTVQNWHFVVTWSTALLAAAGTVIVTFLSSAATDLSNRAVGELNPPSSATATQSPAAQPASNH